jgi:hypothetical protein
MKTTLLERRDVIVAAVFGDSLTAVTSAKTLAADEATRNQGKFAGGEDSFYRH